MGPWHCAPMVAWGTLQRSSAWKMYCRVEKIPPAEADAVSKQLKQYELAVKYAEDEEDAEQINPYDYVPEQYHEVLQKSEKYLGMIERATPHACAHLITNADIRREIGIYRINSKSGKKKVVLAAFIDGATADRFGYLKNDYLKVDIVNVNSDIYDRIGMPQPSVHELMKMTDGDKPTWDLYANGYTLGLNQVEKSATTDRVTHYKPKNMSELCAFVAAIRPAFKSMINIFLDRQHFDYGIPALDKLLQTREIPSSFILYQEQMMKVLQYAGFEASASYAAIKAIAKKHPEKVKPLRERFLEGFAKKLIADDGVSQVTAQETSENVWQIISDACSYGFNACLDGNEKMKGRKYSIATMYRIRADREYAKSLGVERLHDEFNSSGFGWAFSIGVDNRITLNSIVDIRDQGVRRVYRMTLDSGRSVVATENHKFPVGAYDHLVRLDCLSVGDMIFVTDKPGFRTIPEQEEIISIELIGARHVYDVEMANPYHNFLLDSGIVTGNSHSAAVSLDSMYTAWAKAHYPYETYAALMTNYAKKGDKDRIDRARVEMKRAFGISIAPCRYRQDNRTFFIDKEHHTISDTLMSVKCISYRVAQALYEMRDNQYESFTDLLIDMQTRLEFDTRVTEILIRMGYFEEFGHAGKLLYIYRMFNSGSLMYKKTHSAKTKATRREKLIALERESKETDIFFVDQLAFEAEYFGTPLSVYKERRWEAVVLDVDERYSIKVQLYNASKGTVGVMRIKKALYANCPLQKGDVIRVNDFRKTPARRYLNGKSVIDPDRYENWITSYQILPPQDPMTKKKE